MKLVAALLSALIVLSACSNEPSIDDMAESLAAERPELGADGADCILTELQTSYTESELAELVSAESTPTAIEQTEFAQKQLQALRACDLEGQASPGLVEAFAAANGLSPEVAECSVAQLQAQFGFWELTDQLAEEQSTIRFQRRQLEAIFECGDRSEVARQLEPQLVTQGVDRADATCVADALAASMKVDDLSVLYIGQTSDRFFELYFTAVEGCGALPE